MDQSLGTARQASRERRSLRYENETEKQHKESRELHHDVGRN